MIRPVQASSPLTNSLPSDGNNSASRPSSRHARRVAKEFQMFPANVRNDAEVRMDHFHQRRNFAGMICADFEHRRLMQFLQPEQRQRHPNVVVETGFTPEHGQSLSQHRGDSSFVVVFRWTRHGDNRQRKILPVLAANRPNACRTSSTAISAQPANPLSHGPFRQRLLQHPFCDLGQKSMPSNRSPSNAKNTSPDCD